MGPNPLLCIRCLPNTPGCSATISGWNVPKPSSISKKKLLCCWASRSWTTRGPDGTVGGAQAPFRHSGGGLRCAGRVARDVPSPAGGSVPPACCPQPTTDPGARAAQTRAAARHRPAARAAVCRPCPGRDLRHAARPGHLPLLDPYHVPHPPRTCRSARTPAATAACGLSKARAAGARAQPGVVLGHHQADGPEKMDLLLSLCDH